MPTGIRHLLKQIFGKRIGDARIAELANDIAIYTAGFGDELVKALKDEGVHLGHRAACIRREAIAFYAVIAMTHTSERPDRKSMADLLISKLKEQFDPSADVGREKFSFNDSAGGHYDGVTEVNLLARTIDDRIAFYDARFREGAAFKVIIRFAFAAAHVLYGQKLSDKSLDEIKKALLGESGKVKRIEYPDERRDEFIAEWLSKAIEPIQMQFEDFFYMAEFRRIPEKRRENKS